MPNYRYEKNTLLAHIDNSDVVNLLKSTGCFIAGGAITSIFSRKDINDIDVYFRDYKSLKLVLKSLFNIDDDSEDLLEPSSFTLIYTNHTKKSILFTKDNVNLQCIYFRFFNTADEIFSTFDFTINMGVYDCAKEEFVLHEDFIKDIAQRRLKVNPNTAFPIISLLRIDKYKQRGYSISRKDFINLCLAVNKLKINTWEDLTDAIGGMYGYTHENLFDVNKEFSIDESIDQLSKLESELDSISTINFIDYYELIKQINTNLKITPEPDDGIFYKKVVKTNDPNVFTSYYAPSFGYTINYIVNGGEHGLWAYKSIKSAKNHFALSDKSKEAIIMLKINDASKIIREHNKSFKLIGDVSVIQEIILDNNEPNK